MYCKKKSIVIYVLYVGRVYINFVSITRVTSSCSISLNVGIVICIVSSVSVRPVNKIALEKKNGLGHGLPQVSSTSSVNAVLHNCRHNI